MSYSVRHHFKPNALPLLLAFALVLGSNITQAQEQTLQSVLVTAGRLQSREFETPASTFSVDQNAISNSGAQVNLSDALTLAPGVVSMNRNNYAQDVQLSIRGFGARTPFGLRGIRIIADDIPLTTPDGQGQASSISLTSVDHLEVLSGPLAQLYGNSSGGVIQTQTRQATNTPQGSLQTYLGSYGLVRTDWQASTRFEHLGVVADLSTFKIDGWRSNSAAKREQFNGVLTYDAQSDTQIKWVLNSFRMPTAQDPLGLNASQLQINPSQAGTNALIDQTQKSVEQDQIGWVMHHALNADLKLQLRLYHGNRENTQTQASSSALTPQVGSWVGLQRTYDGLGLQLKGRENTHNVDWDWVFGVDLDRSSENRQSGITNSGVITPAPTSVQNVASNSDFYLQSNAYLSDKWTLTAGLRHDQVKIDNTNFSNASLGGSSNFSTYTPVMGLVWHAQERLNLYTNAGLGFETPTTTETAYSLSGSTVAAAFNSGLRASQSHNFEIGLKWLPTPMQWVNAALFHITTNNDIVATTNVSGKTVYGNVAQTSREGFELSMLNASDQHFHQQLAWGLIKAKYDASFTESTGLIAAGNAMPAIPQNTLSTALKWSEKGYLNKGTSAPEGMEVEFDVTARSSMWANDANSIAASSYGYAAGYAMLDLKVHERYALGPLSLEAYAAINNMTNRSYVGSVIVNSSNAAYFEPGLPRNWTLGLKLSTAL
jgi:iron complex outermembrane receptor protein